MSGGCQSPIIGVLSQEISTKLEAVILKIYKKNTFGSYIAASYVKFLESSGARVVPIRIGKDRSYYESLVKKLNGVFFPGGATYFNQSNGYADAGEHIYKVACELNETEDYFPLWGTCLGFELMPYLWLGRGDTQFRCDCSSHNQVSSLRFADDFKSSKLFGSAPEEVISILSEKEVTFNYHMYCVTEKIFDKNNMGNEWKILSTNDDSNKLHYISSMESTRFPFYGVQFHPEKPQFEWPRNGAVPHSRDAVTANRYFADFFVDECRKSGHHFDSPVEEEESLIYNFPVTNTGRHGMQYAQCYLFTKDGIQEQ